MKINNKKTIIIVSIIFLVIVLLVSLVINNLKEGLDANATPTKDPSTTCIGDPVNSWTDPTYSYGNFGKWVDDPSWNFWISKKDSKTNKIPVLPVKNGYANPLPYDMIIDKMQRPDSKWSDKNWMRDKDFKNNKIVWHCTGDGRGNNNQYYDRYHNVFESNSDRSKNICPNGLVKFRGYPFDSDDKKEKSDNMCRNPPTTNINNIPIKCSGYDTTHGGWYYGFKNNKRQFLCTKDGNYYVTSNPKDIKHCPSNNFTNVNNVCYYNPDSNKNCPNGLSYQVVNKIGVCK